MTTLQPSFDDCLFTLSTISHRLQFSRPLENSPLQQKHLKLLNLLALLMVTEPNGDVAATTLIQTTSSVTFLFSKNRPCTAPELSYIQTLQDIITTREASSMIEIRGRALSLVIGNCSRKIKARINKFVSRLKTLQSNFTVKPPPPNTSILLRERLKPIEFRSDIPLEESITNWLTKLLKAPTIALDGTHATVTLFIAHAIGYTKGIDSVIDDPVLLRRLQKLGDYYAAVCCLVKAYSKLEPPLSITVREIAPPPPKSITLKYDVLDTVNAWACHRNHDPLTLENLVTAYPSLASSLPVSSTYWFAPPDNPPPRTVMTSVHAECTLLDYLITLNLSFLEFGSSKNVCWTCERFISALGNSYTGKIYFSGRQGKVHPGWQFPEGTSVATREIVEQYLNDEMDTLLARSARTRHSDSEPTGYNSEEEASPLDMDEKVTENAWTVE